MQGPDGLFHIGDRRYGGKAGNSVCTVNGTSFFFSPMLYVYLYLISMYIISMYIDCYIYISHHELQICISGTLERIFLCERLKQKDEQHYMVIFPLSDGLLIFRKPPSQGSLLKMKRMSTRCGDFRRKTGSTQKRMRRFGQIPIR